MLDLRLLEDGSERGGALGSDVVETETASDGQNGNSERVGVSMGADTKANTLWAGGALDRPNSVVPRQVKREQLRVRSIEVAG